jgi:glycosyltransferase involved in cell wall biosynthesis
MRILSIAAGAGGMYCGSCLRDNALASELIKRGHDVTLLPLYTPLLTDETNVSRPQVLFSGIGIYLQQKSAIFRRLPRFVDRLFDSPRVISAFASRSSAVDARLLGDLTIAMLDGADGVLRREFDKLVEWTAGEPPPDVVNITNSMLIGLARPLREALRRPVCCTLQGEDLFVQNLVEPYRSRARTLIQAQVGHVDRFIAVSDYYADFMAGYLNIPRDRVSVVPLGINLDGFGVASSDRESGRAAPARAFTVGYLGRIAPEKGLLQLAEAFTKVAKDTGEAIRLEAAGYMADADRAYLDRVRALLQHAGLADRFSHRGTVDRQGKVAFLHGIDVMSMPATYDEPKGFTLLEAMAAGVPVVQPRRGSFTEIVERTGGGILVEPDNPSALAEGLHTLMRERDRRLALGAQGRAGVEAHYTIQRSAHLLANVFTEVGSLNRVIG